MSPVHAHTITPTLETMVANFLHWRAHRARRGNVPPKLMERGAALADHYSARAVALCG